MEQTKPFIVLRDGELDEQLSILEPEYSSLDALLQRVGTIASSLSLQASMAVYDRLHGTHYRAVRNELVRVQRNHEFEARIGLIAVSKN